MPASYFFGYGSLVNLNTHSYPATRPCSLDGWRRKWCGVAGRGPALLSVRPVSGQRIDGMTAQVPGNDWAALDQRESGYGRHAARSVSGLDVQVYQVRDDIELSDTAAPILLSYLDVVVQGFLTHFGEDGVARFFASTDNWDRPVLDDRHTPRYPRHQKLSENETVQVDAHLHELGIHPVRQLHNAI
ncbi:gamma-glutamylcyclotransferase family protein [Qingshengfaniella alkalisoli]|uniref:glutathione-specific gamma-glutamylcyclotransferase n=1 Tax=Qingshengfaniella alkalisoli TaxID=2599296 RepID=A0A5B8IVG4_9RHOB|nr:gamma-glutamylcyclotransferase family protein [Qingshengfaniella alkalisoli]QDY69604.1 gamma-glutamylcyclotransferase [Qingshengfaniella alkalisoli]